MVRNNKSGAEEIVFYDLFAISHMFTITYRFAFFSLSLLKSNLLRGIELAHTNSTEHAIKSNTTEVEERSKKKKK